MINSIMTATNQEQWTNIVLIASAEIRKREESILPPPVFMDNCPTISHT